MSTTSRTKPPLKRLIVCCDGTWQSSNHGVRGVPSNIAKLARSIATCDTRGSEPIHQFVWYDAGVGTATDSGVGTGAGLLGSMGNVLSTLFRDWSGFSGNGLNEKVCEAYGFLADNYNPGDELYFFGFSRGAYTARAAAGLVGEEGIVRKDMMDEFPAMYRAYRQRGPNTGASTEGTKWRESEIGIAFKEACSYPQVKLVGCFDTVGALGIPRNAILSKATTDAFNEPLEFHNTALSDKIEHAFHAMALSEHRQSFQPTLWTLSEPMHARPDEDEGEDLNKHTNLIQCWFPGVHINVGGGNGDCLKPERQGDVDMEGMANLTFAWMVDRVAEHTGLLFDDEALEKIVSGFESGTGIVKARGNYRGWGVGPINDRAFESYRSAGSEIRTPGAYRTPDTDNAPLGRTHEFIHPVAKYAGYGDAKEPAKVKFPYEALKGFKRSESTDKHGQPVYLWTKEEVPEVKGTFETIPGEDAAQLKEWKIPDLINGRLGMERRLMQADFRTPPVDENLKGVVRNFQSQLDKFHRFKEAIAAKL